jgi:RNA polymerase sigma factor (sigma-70 family)
MTVGLPPFQDLLDAHGHDVHRFLVASVGRHDADDCYQDTWLSALRAYPGLRSAANLRSWIFTVAHRKAIDQLRARSRRALPVPDAEAAMVAGGASSAAPAAEQLFEQDLWSQVARLPDKQRTAVALRYVVDAGYEEIAAVMGTSREAARRSVHEGLKHLREEYQP